MPLYSNNNRTILLVHIPKTGGSSLEEMLVDAGAAQALKFHKRLGYSACTPQHMHWEVLCRWVPKSFYSFSLTIVRNPFERLASEYAWREKVSDTPISEFNTWVRETLIRYKKNPYIYDNHIRPQVDFVGPRVKVFKLEDGLNPAAKMAFRRLGLTYRKPETPHVRKSDHKLITIEHSILEDIRAFYAADFEAYEYDPAVVPTHLFHVVPDPEPEPEVPVVELVPPPPAPLWRRAGRKVNRTLKTAIKRATPE
tara:strand:+ start:1443 stop:2201 length:759 start_codon:yes stop_codon:yes gene_type:complete